MVELKIQRCLCVCVFSTFLQHSCNICCLFVSSQTLFKCQLSLIRPDNSIDRGVLRLKMLRSKGVSGTRFVTMRYEGWVDGWVGGQYG